MRRLTSFLIPVALAAAALFMPRAGTMPAVAWPAQQAEAGAKSHTQVLGQFGGEISNAQLASYIDRIGRRIIAVTNFAHEDWTFTVLDTPVVNAFAIQGGYVYLTRGMLALANSEAEIAAVIGHEIAHITAKHHASREERGNKAGLGVLIGTAIGGILGGKDGLKDGIQLSSRLAQGYVSQFSQKQEFEADTIGTRYLSAAGYDPMAQSRILGALAAKRALEARIAGKSYNPNRVDFFASHPATADRVRRVGNLAQTLPGSEVSEAAYMFAIDGMIYGDSAAQGFVRGRRFVHPEIGFEFTVPEGFIITNSTRSVRAEGPNGARFILDSGGPANGSLTRYIRRTWLRQIEEQYGDARLYGLQDYQLGGVQAATALVDITLRGKPTTVITTLVSHKGRFHRLSGIAAAQDWNALMALSDAAQSYRALSASEAANELPYRLRVLETRGRDTVETMAAQSALPSHAQDIFRTMNGLGAGPLQRGDLVKLVVE